jgi:spore maturation protein CgeB
MRADEDRPSAAGQDGLRFPRQPMKLTFFGSSIVSSYWNGAATYYRGLIRALHVRGHRVTFCEPDAYGRQEHRDLERDPEYARVVVFRTEAEREALLDEAFARSDWVVKCSGVGIWDDELERGVAERAGGGARAAYLDVDAPATLARMESDPSDPLRAWIPRFDHILTYGGGPPVRERYRALGARECTAVYNALDPDEHHPLAERVPAYDLLFMGNRLPDREERVGEFYFRAAEFAPEARFALGGEGWGDVELPPNVEWLGHVPTARHNEVNADARLVLNIHRESMVRNGWSPATRMFEAAGAAACQITDRWEGLDRFFEPGREILVAADGAAVARIVRATSLAEARRIGAAARDRALREHTYALRAIELDRILRAEAASESVR